MRSSLRALNQSVSSQVATLMRDPHKLLHRTRVPRAHSNPLCGGGSSAGGQVGGVCGERGREGGYGQTA